MGTFETSPQTRRARGFLNKEVKYVQYVIHCAQVPDGPMRWANLLLTSCGDFFPDETEKIARWVSPLALHF